MGWTAVGAHERRGDGRHLERTRGCWGTGPSPDRTTKPTATHPTKLRHQPDPVDTPFKEAGRAVRPGLRSIPDDGEALDAAGPTARWMPGSPRSGTTPTPTRPPAGERGRATAARADRDLRPPHRPHPRHRHRRTPRRRPRPAARRPVSELVGHGPYVVKPVIDLNERSASTPTRSPTGSANASS